MLKENLHYRLTISQHMLLYNARTEFINLLVPKRKEHLKYIEGGFKLSKQFLLQKATEISEKGWVVFLTIQII